MAEPSSGSSEPLILTQDPTIWKSWWEKMKNYENGTRT